MATTRKSNVVRSSVTTTSLGVVTPVEGVSLYRYSSNRPNGSVEITFTAPQVGTTTHKWEVNITPKAGVELVKLLIRELGIDDPAEVGIYGYVPRPKEETPQEG